MKPIRGFTLIELVMTIAILGILLTIGIPSFRELTTRNRITTQANEFMADIAHARAEAVRRNTRVTICKSNDGANCVTSANWQEGWIIFTDPSGYGTYTSTSADEKLLRVHGPLSGTSTLVPALFDNAGNYFQFSPSGQAIGVSGGTPSTMGTFVLCVSGYRGRTIGFNTTGRVSITTMAGNCP